MLNSNINEPQSTEEPISNLEKKSHRIGTIRKPGEQIRLYLKPNQVEEMIEAAKKSGRHSKRNTLMVMMAYKHGLRASELCEMKWDDIDLIGATITVRRKKAGHNKPPPSREHDLDPEELRRLKKLSADRPGSVHVFISQQNLPINRRQFHRIVSDLGKVIGVRGPVYPHRLRHSCGYKLASEDKPTRNIQKYLGHSQINNTAWYTDVADEKIKKLWD